MTPSAHSFRMPAEWERHEGTWIAWPHQESDWPGKFAAIPWVYGEIARRLAAVERLHVIVEDADCEQLARAVFADCGVNEDSVDYYLHATDRSWTRDFCPLFVKNPAGEIAATKWRFNGWAKYNDWHNDDAVARALAAARGVHLWEAGLVLEGGSIDVNGAGQLLTTEECLLSDVQARNPGVGREKIENAFAEYLGISETIWLRNGIAGDDTHGHVDDLARFVARDTIVIASESDPSDLNYAPLKENLELLRARRDLRVVTLPMPAPVYFAGQRLPASYANFYIANQLVLVPTFNDPNDRVAIETLQQLFPDRMVTGIHSVDLVLGLGTLHCMTQQQPE